MIVSVKLYYAENVLEFEYTIVLKKYFNSE